jgi:hypothetical protein
MPINKNELVAALHSWHDTGSGPTSEKIEAMLESYEAAKVTEQPVGSDYHRGFNDGLKAASAREETMNKREVSVEDRITAAEIIAKRYADKLKDYEAPHNAAVYGQWAFDDLLQHFDIRRRGSDE